MDWNGSLQAVTAADSCGLEEDKANCIYTVDKLSQEHAVLVDNSWKFKNNLSLQMLEGLIQHEKLLGLFIPGVAEPVAWITIYRLASLFIPVFKVYPPFAAMAPWACCTLWLNTAGKAVPST